MLKLATDISQIIPTRNFNMSYIFFDCIFLIFLVTLLILKKRYLTLCWALFGGLLYLFVDFGLFYSLSHTRRIFINDVLLTSQGHFWVLLWLSLSYGIPNFIFIWMALNKDKLFKIFTLVIVGWWIVLPTLSQFGLMNCFNDTLFGATVRTERDTGNFHWIMAAFLIVGYGAYISYIILKDRDNIKEDIKTLLILNAIGIACQFSWEFPLLLNGIRPFNDKSIQTLLINSFIETNSGMVYFYLFNLWITKKIGLQENLTIGKEKARIEEAC